MNLGPVYISPAFFMTAALAVSFADGRLLMPLYISSVAHEAGHILMIRLCGGSVERLKLGCLGAEISIKGDLSYGKELLCALGGPAVNLMLAAAAGKMGSPLWAGVNLILMTFNLLPLSVLDGGRALFMLIAWAAGPAAAAKAAMYMDMGLAAVLIAEGLYVCAANCAVGSLAFTTSAVIAALLWGNTRRVRGQR